MLMNGLGSLLRRMTPCSLRLTTAFLESKKLDVQRVVPWLREHGGYCDCEVLANVEDGFGDLIR